MTVAERVEQSACGSILGGGSGLPQWHRRTLGATRGLEGRQVYQMGRVGGCL